MTCLPFVVERDDGLRPELLLLSDDEDRLHLIVGGLLVLPGRLGRREPLCRGHPFPKARGRERRFGHNRCNNHMHKPARFARAALVALALAPSLLVDAASQARPGVHPISGRRFAAVMGYQGADWLDRSERVEEARPDRALDIIKIQPGWTVADVGAGSGYMSAKMARRVGPSGKVYANDIQPQMLALLQERLAKEKITNVEPVLGTAEDPKLPGSAIDLILMVDVYHEFQQPQ